MRVTVQPTSNPWDAPFYAYTYPDGRMEVRRDHGLPADPAWSGSSAFTHAVVFVDGAITPFDARRQPRHALRRYMASGAPA